METNTVTIQNEDLTVRILLPGSYSGSRYDHSCMVEQISLGDNTFLSREKIGNGFGLGGIGLAFCFEWADTSLHDETAIADLFPMIGIGLLKQPDTSPFLFTRDYPVIPFEHLVSTDENSVTVHTLPHLCHGMAFDQIRHVRVDGHSLIVSCSLKNEGSRNILGTEFCHNFFQFNSLPIDSHYRLSFPYSIIPKIRRGQLLIERDALYPGAFDQPTASTAFWLTGYDGLQSHWMKLENDLSHTGILVEEDFPVSKIYSWNNEHALCPETFISLAIAPGESMTWTRKYTFYSF